MLVKEIKKDLNKWRYTACPEIGRLNIVKTPISPKLIHRFHTVNIPSKFGEDIDKLNLKCIWKGKITSRAKTISKRRIN